MTRMSRAERKAEQAQADRKEEKRRQNAADLDKLRRLTDDKQRRKDLDRAVAKRERRGR